MIKLDKFHLGMPLILVILFVIFHIFKFGDTWIDPIWYIAMYIIGFLSLILGEKLIER